MSDELKKSRHEIYSLHSSVSADELGSLLKENQYASDGQWRKFLDLLLPILGFSFIVAGIVFFFAYNWDNLARFGKFGLVGLLLISSVLVAVCGRWKLIYKQLFLTVASCMVGVLFAVYGQTYQTGADSYELFLSWTVAITVWVLIGRFEPLWLLWIMLVNLTVSLYAHQALSDGVGLIDYLPAFQSLFLFCCAAVTELLAWKGIVKKRQAWFVVTLFVASIVYNIYYLISVLLRHYSEHCFELYLVAFVLTGLVLGLGAWFGYTRRNITYLALSSFAFLIVIISLLVRAVPSQMYEAFLLFIGFVCVCGTTAIVVMINKLKKEWNGK